MWQMAQQLATGPPAESLYGKKRKGASNATTRGKEAHDVESSDDSDSTMMDEENKIGDSRPREMKTEAEIVDIRAAVPGGIKHTVPNRRVSFILCEF